MILDYDYTFTTPYTGSAGVEKTIEVCILSLMRLCSVLSRGFIGLLSFDIVADFEIAMGSVILTSHS